MEFESSSQKRVFHRFCGLRGSLNKVPAEEACRIMAALDKIEPQILQIITADPPPTETLAGKREERDYRLLRGVRELVAVSPRPGKHHPHRRSYH